MSSERVSIFYTGATGYIGGSVLQRILEHPRANTFDITVLVRNAEKAKLLESKFPVKAAVGSLQDFDKLTEYTKNSHVVVNTADADNDAVMKAILAGLKQRHEELGDTPILIHTSGTAFLMDDARGEFTSSTITSDLDIAALDAIPPSALHHSVDLLAVAADKEGYARAYLLVPGTIFGVAHGPLYEAGISHSHSIQIPMLADISLKRGRAGVVGKGANVWPAVHIDDLAQIYYLLFDAALYNASNLGHGREGYYFVAADEYRAYDVCKAIGDALVALGRAEEAEPAVFTPEERVKYFGSDLFAYLMFTNARCRAERGRRDLGWEPKYKTEDLIKSIRGEVEFALTK